MSVLVFRMGLRRKTALTTQGRAIDEQVPISDTSKGATWAEGAGDSDADAFDELDEGVAAADEATTFWFSASAGTGATPIKLKLTARDVPTDPTAMDIRIQQRCRVGDIASIKYTLYSPVGTARFTESTSATVAEGWTVHRPNGTNNDLSSFTDWTDVHIEISDEDDQVGELLDISMVSIKQG